jgi:hypothetical protein
LKRAFPDLVFVSVNQTEINRNTSSRSTGKKYTPQADTGGWDENRVVVRILQNKGIAGSCAKTVEGYKETLKKFPNPPAANVTKF